jgi:hypothetical protein
VGLLDCPLLVVALQPQLRIGLLLTRLNPEPH